MQLKELIQKTDRTLYNYLQGQSLKVHQSKQKELLQVINGQTKLENITADKINSYIEHLQNKNNSNKTINTKLSYIRNILRYAYNMGWTKSIPYIKNLKTKSNKITRYYSELEQDLMLEWSKHHCYVLYEALVIGFNTGLRISDILTIINNIKSIKIENNYIHLLIQKTQTELSIPLNKHLQELTQEWQEYTINYMQIQYLFKKMLKEINILDTEATIHKIRHTFCSRLVEKGVPLPVIQKLAGHKKITTTMLYTHVKDTQLEQAVALL